MYRPGSLMNTSMWSSKMATVYFGTCHTFIHPDKFLNTDELLFYLYLHLEYRVYIHDPKFFIPGPNPLVTPRYRTVQDSKVQ